MTLDICMPPSLFNYPYESCYASLIRFAFPVGFSALCNYVVLGKVFDNWMWLKNSITVFWTSDVRQEGLTL